MARQLIQEFRLSPQLRIAVTVDMIATGTDVKPLECLLFLRDVRSRVYFEQMKGRGTRVLSATDLQAVSGAEARAKTHFVIVDAVGVCESDKTDSRPLDRKPTDARKLLLGVALGNATKTRSPRWPRGSRAWTRRSKPKRNRASPPRPAARPSPRSRTTPARVRSRRHRRTSHAESRRRSARSLTRALEQARSRTDRRSLRAVRQTGAPRDARNAEAAKANRPSTSPRSTKSSRAASTPPRKPKPKNSSTRSATTREHKSEINALQILYSRPYKQRLTEPMLKELEKKLRDNHAAWTEDRLWDAFAVTAPGKVKGRSQAGRFADLVALVRFALEQQPVLAPFADSVSERFNEWLMDKAKAGAVFTPEQLAWLNLIRDHIATSLSIEPEISDLSPFNQRGGLGKAHQLFGEQLPRCSMSSMRCSRHA